MDIEPLNKIRSVTRERVCWSARSGIISGALAEDNLQKQIKEGKAENADLDHLRYERLGVEIEVLRRGMAEQDKRRDRRERRE
ncbi:MAG TPA: hypothetical protein VF020_18775 [Chthoniobacterales bacterium]